MTTYEYEFIDTGDIVEIEQSMKDSKFEELVHPETGTLMKVKRLISNNGNVIFKGDGWTIHFEDRGYKGKFKKKIRERGDVVAPANKAEADRQFQNFIDSGGLTGIKPSMNLGGSSPQTTEQMLDKNYKPN